jgi:hypothetical protein
LWCFIQKLLNESRSNLPSKTGFEPQVNVEAIVENQNAVMGKLDDISEQLQELGSRLRSVLQKNVELKNLLNTLITGSFPPQPRPSFMIHSTQLCFSFYGGAYECPTLFVLLPVVETTWISRLNPLKFVRDKYRLFFLCAHTMQIAPCGPDGKTGFALTCPKEWVVKAAPYIKIGLILLKEVLATYLIPLPIGESVVG